MKILVIGDLHGRIPKDLPKNGIDLILLTGDLGKADLARKMAFENIKRAKKGLPGLEYSPRERKKAFMQSYSSSLKVVKSLAKIALVYTVYGNVESSNSETREESKEIGLNLPFLTNDLMNIKNVRVINNKLANFKRVRIGGLKYFIDVSWVREFKPNDYSGVLEGAKRETNNVKMVLSNFKEVDILICHQPPYGVLDKVSFASAPKSWKGKHAGSKIILDYIKRYKPKYVFCGHIHESSGVKKVGRTEVYNLGSLGYKIVEI